MIECIVCGEEMMRLEHGVYWCKTDDLIALPLLGGSIHWYKREKD